ncbi:endolytic transglycosylase MltG [Terribacillus sp. DMT04]|uniref:endolytic transglycosylase MltG n=1 Tax=Terribacillus sp. DMT04 TaxID=2850441 RepID=UPI001C2CAE16|nr:endolytic transglycosylase MltG [Terribacillus sp. DMT04]QXE00510.1 endolytic transglycosylase MltG [Terribacillus sp. DMT04]
MTASNDDLYQQNQDRRMEEASVVRKIVLMTISVIIVLLLIGALGTFIYVNASMKAVDSDNDTTQVVEVPMGSTASSIAASLEDQGLIKNAFIFRLYVKFSGEANFRAGNFELSPSMSMQQIVDKLNDPEAGSTPSASAAVPEGSDIEEISSILSETLGINQQDFLDKMKDEAYIRQLISEYPGILTDDILQEDIRYPLEGYLFAATYSFLSDDSLSIDNIVHMMLDKSQQIITPYLDDFKQRDLTIHEAVTFASLVENEARNKEERNMIAGIFYNRLADDMKLQTDPTVLYALGEHKPRVYYKDLEVDSPYNTYRIKGLPVGPISNFSESSLQSVVNPKTSDYLYFLAGDNGQIYYARTFDEHEELIEKHMHVNE